MAYIETIELAADRSCSLSKNYQRKYTRKFLVIFDSVSGPQQALTATGIPEYGDSYNVEYPPGTVIESDSDAIITDISASIADGFNYYVTAQYSTEASPEEKKGEVNNSNTSGEAGGTAGQSSTPPNSRDWSVTIDTETEELVLEKDYSTPTPKPIENSAGMPYLDPPIMYQKYFTILNVKIPRDSWALAKKLAYEGRRNSSTFTILNYTFPAGTLLITRYNGATAKDGSGSPYWELTISFKYDPDEHVKKILDAGLYEKKTLYGVTVKRRITDELGQPIEKPVKLNGSGQVETGSTITRNLFQPYETANFATLL